MGLGYEASVSSSTRPHFATTTIDAEVLCDLTDADLEKLGVTLGHRKRLLKAIAESGARGASRDADKPAPSIVTDAPNAARSR